MARGKYAQSKKLPKSTAVAPRRQPPRPGQRGEPGTGQLVQMLQQELFTGPLPHPDSLRGYEEVLPGAAERILTMAEEQGRHRRHLETVVVVGNSRRSSLGLWLGFVVAVLFLAAAVVLIFRGHDWAGSVVGGVDIVGLVAVFVVGRVDQRRERVAKANR